MLIALALAAAVVSDDPDGVVTTAPRGPGAVIVGAEAPTTDATPQASAVTPHNLTTRQQIDRWIAARDPDLEPFAQGIGPEADDRKVHGFVSGSIGTNDYSSASVGVSVPIGESGRLDMTYTQSKNGWYDGYGYPGDYGYAERPFAGYAPYHGPHVRSGRSLSLGYRWDRDEARRERGASDARAFTAQD